jgi:hypothetical protein
MRCTARSALGPPLRRRCHKIDLSTDECRLEYTSMHKDFLREFEDKITGAAPRRAQECLMRLTNLARPRLRLLAARPAPRSLYREPRQLRRGTLRGARCGKSLKHALLALAIAHANVASPKSPPDTDNDMFVQILNATLDFDVFMLMMRETAKEEQRSEKEAKAKQRGKAR